MPDEAARENAATVRVEEELVNPNVQVGTGSPGLEPTARDAGARAPEAEEPAELAPAEDAGEERAPEGPDAAPGNDGRAAHATVSPDADTRGTAESSEATPASPDPQGRAR